MYLRLGTNQLNLGANRLNLFGYQTTVGTNRLDTGTLIFLLFHLFHWFAVLSGVIISRRGASCLRTFTSENLAFDFGMSTSTLSEFIGYADSTDFREISPEHGDNNKPKCVEKF